MTVPSGLLAAMYRLNSLDVVRRRIGSPLGPYPRFWLASAWAFAVRAAAKPAARNDRRNGASPRRSSGGD